MVDYIVNAIVIHSFLFLVQYMFGLFHWVLMYEEDMSQYFSYGLEASNFISSTCSRLPPLILILKMLYIQISIMASFDGVVLPLVKQDFCLCRSFLGLTCSQPGYKLVIRWLQASHEALKGVAGAICPATTREHHTCIFLRRIRVMNL